MTARRRTDQRAVEYADNRSVSPAPMIGFVLVGLLSTPAVASTPMSYLTGDGLKAFPVTRLTWGLLILSIAVVVVTTCLVCLGVWRRRTPRENLDAEIARIEHGSGVQWITIGVGISSVLLVGSLIWTMAVLADVNGPPARSSSLTIEVTGQQWWWKARYLNGDPSKVLTTADEIHIPVGRPVRIKLIGADVIHSFWVPALSGKMDTIPGQINETWIQASKPGRYRGQCSEYCGAQHAHMAFFVTAESPTAFQKWLDDQLQPAISPATPDIAKDEHVFEAHCGACHTVRGSLAGGSVAPDLTHLMSRETLAAGTLPNTPGDLAAWIANPQSLKPGTYMPNLYLSGSELTDIATYLQTLK